MVYSHLGLCYLSVIRSLEVVRISEADSSIVKSIRSTWFVRYIKVVRILEGPLSEVSHCMCKNVQ